MENNLNSIQQMQLDKLNKGFNFFNFIKTEKKYYINVSLEVEQDLEGREEKIMVYTNLNDIGHYWGCDLKTFLKELEEFCNQPFAQVRVTRIKEKDYNGRYVYRTFSNSEIKVRDKTINLFDIKIEIGKLAKQKLQEMNVDFEDEVKKCLKKQKDISKKIQDKIDRYIVLKEKKDMLKSLIKVDNDNYYYSSKPKENTLKIMLSPNEYNCKLKEIETEFRELEKSLGMKETRFEYIKIEEELTFEEWLKKNEKTLRENYEQAQEESGETETTFNEYSELVFENGGLNEEESSEEYEDEDEEFTDEECGE